MGYSTRLGTTITDFWPDETNNRFYIVEGINDSLQDIIDRVKEKWGDSIDLSNITIGAEHIHTHCLGYDCYDPSDYTDFVVVTLNK